MNKIALHIFRFILLLGIQIFFCNYVHIMKYMNPYLYIMALLLLPITIPKWIQYLIAFSVGMVIDFSLQSYGVQSFACVLMMFFRPYIGILLSEEKKVDKTGTSFLISQGFLKTLVYTLMLIFVHHVCIVFLEAFSLQYFWRNLLIAGGNTLLTTSLILCLIQFTRRKNRVR